VRDELLAYYEGELAFLRQMGAQFAEKYPKIASRLGVTENRCDDPHVERLLEGFAFLAGRIHLKIDDEFPEITEALLNILYPHYLRPIPSLSLAEFHMDPEQNTPPEGLKVPKGSIMHSRPIDGLPLKFRTCYDMTLWPLAIRAAQWTSPDRLQPSVRGAGAAALRVVVQTTGAATFDQLKIPSLRLHLNGVSKVVHSLYELLCNNCSQIVVRDPTPGSERRQFSLDPSKIRPVGFAEDEDALPYPRRSFVGYRLLQEYFSFPEKFFFLDIEGLDALQTSGFKNVAEIIFLISSFQDRTRQQTLEVGVSERTLRLACSPIVNLFPKTAEPVLLSQTKYEYALVPDVAHPKALEVFSVDRAVSVDPQLPEPIVFSPFYSQKYRTARDNKQAFWHTKRRPSLRAEDERSDVYISLVDMSGRPMVPNVEALTVEVTCTNGNLPADMPFGNERGDLELQGVVPVKRITIIQKPSRSVPPPLGKDAAWRLISHLSLNYLSLVDDGKDALQNVLRLYNFADTPHTEKQIQSITKLRSSRRFARIKSEHGISFGRGTKVEIDLDEEQFVGGAVYLFCSVLESFFSLYVSMNSFCEVVAQTAQRKEVLKHWQPRAGQRILV
jgi:type VI secretion system protein ImpG